MRPVFELWIDNVRTGSAVLSAEAEASEERAIQAQEERRSRIADPVRLEQEVSEIRQRVENLREKKNNLSRLVDSLTEEVARERRRLATEAVNGCEEILKAIQSIADCELLHAVEPLLSADAQARFNCAFQELVPAQLEVLIRESLVLKETRDAVRAYFCAEATETARLGEYRREVEKLRARRNQLRGSGPVAGQADEPGLLDQVCRQLLEYHGLSPALLENILCFPEAGRLVRQFLEPALADAEIEQTWAISSNVLSEVIGELGRSETTGKRPANESS